MRVVPLRPGGGAGPPSGTGAGTPRERTEAPAAFRAALRSLREAPMRAGVVLAEAPAPHRLAPWAVALTADIPGPDGEDGEDLATGRIVVLHDPDGQEAWQGTFRVVTFLRASLEPEMVVDPLLPEVGWDWMLESLEGRGARHIADSGTVTSVASVSFGGMAERPATAEIEIRASWTPVASGEGSEAVAVTLGTHLQAWCDLLCTAAGRPPLPDGVAGLG